MADRASRSGHDRPPRRSAPECRHGSSAKVRTARGGVGRLKQASTGLYLEQLFAEAKNFIPYLASDAARKTLPQAAHSKSVSKGA